MITNEEVKTTFDEFLIVYGRFTGSTAGYHLIYDVDLAGYQVQLTMPNGSKESIFGMDWLSANEMYYALRMSRQVAVQMNGFLREAKSLMEDAQERAGIRKKK